MSPEIRRVRDDELRAYLRTVSTAFMDHPADLDKVTEEIRGLWDLSRVWVAVGDDQILGTFRSWATELTVPGEATVAGAAVTGVTVLSTHRRRGLLRGLVAAEHAAARARDDVVSVLYASEYPIYGRFGYGMACRQATWSLDATSTGFHGPTTGSVRFMDPSVDARDALMAVFEAWRHRQVGELRRRDYIWDFDLALRPDTWGQDWKGFLAVHRDDAGAIDGYVRYHAKSKWELRQPRNLIEVDELHALTDDASAALWRFLAETDWVATITAERRSPSDRLPWILTNARAASITEQGDALWVRLLDLPRALEARTYAGEGSVVLDIVDPEASGGHWRVALDVGPDGARCTPTDKSPELTVHTSAVAAAYLGGTRLRDAAVATGGMDEHRAGAGADAERLLRMPDEPWCSTFF